MKARETFRSLLERYLLCLYEGPRDLQKPLAKEFVIPVPRDLLKPLGKEFVIPI